MAQWQEIASAEPDFSRRIEQRFAMGVNKTIATLRSDGAPRISAIELEFTDGDIRLGMMGGSVKLLDVRRDPRVAIHSPTIDTPDDSGGSPGDAKIAGVLVEIPPPPGADDDHPGAGFFALDLHEVAFTYVGTPPDHLVIESWHPHRGWTRRCH